MEGENNKKDVLMVGGIWGLERNLACPVFFTSSHSHYAPLSSLFLYQLFPLTRGHMLCKDTDFILLTTVSPGCRIIQAPEQLLDKEING